MGPQKRRLEDSKISTVCRSNAVTLIVPVQKTQKFLLFVDPFDSPMGTSVQKTQKFLLFVDIYRKSCLFKSRRLKNFYCLQIVFSYPQCVVQKTQKFLLFVDSFHSQHLSKSRRLKNFYCLQIGTSSAIYGSLEDSKISTVCRYGDHSGAGDVQKTQKFLLFVDELMTINIHQSRRLKNFYCLQIKIGFRSSKKSRRLKNFYCLQMLKLEPSRHAVQKTQKFLLFVDVGFESSRGCLEDSKISTVCRLIIFLLPLLVQKTQKFLLFVDNASRIWRLPVQKTQKFLLFVDPNETRSFLLVQKTQKFLLFVDFLLGFAPCFVQKTQKFLLFVDRLLPPGSSRSLEDSKISTVCRQIFSDLCVRVQKTQKFLLFVDVTPQFLSIWSRRLKNFYCLQIVLASRQNRWSRRLKNFYCLQIKKSGSEGGDVQKTQKFLLFVDQMEVNYDKLSRRLKNFYCLQITPFAISRTVQKTQKFLLFVDLACAPDADAVQKTQKFLLFVDRFPMRSCRCLEDSKISTVCRFKSSYSDDKVQKTQKFLLFVDRMGC